MGAFTKNVDSSLNVSGTVSRLVQYSTECRYGLDGHTLAGWTDRQTGSLITVLRRRLAHLQKMWILV